MTRVDIGEIVITQKIKGFLNDKIKTFTLCPTFENIAKIGDSEKIIEVYSTLVSNNYAQLVKSFSREMNATIADEIKSNLSKQINYAELVMSSCSSSDISKLKISKDDKVNIAISLMQYGVGGKAKVRISQRNENKSYTAKIDIEQYINNARVHLGLSFDEAKKLTMTEYILLMANKFPDNESMTAKDYDDVMAEYKKNKAERLKRSAKGG